MRRNTLNAVYEKQNKTQKQTKVYFLDKGMAGGMILSFAAYKTEILTTLQLKDCPRKEIVDRLLITSNYLEFKVVECQQAHIFTFISETNSQMR